MNVATINITTCLAEKESDFTTARGRNQNKSRIAEKIVADWAVDRQCEKNMQAMERKIKVME